MEGCGLLWIAVNCGTHYSLRVKGGESTKEDMPVYTKRFKEQVLRRMVGPRAESATRLSAELGVSQSTLSIWLRQSGTRAHMAANRDSNNNGSGGTGGSTPRLGEPRAQRMTTPASGARQQAQNRAGKLSAAESTFGMASSPPGPAASPRRPQDWSAEEKLQAVLEASQHSETELGAFLRRKGLHEEHLAAWRHMAIEALDSRGRAKKAKAVSEGKRTRDLEKEVRALEKEVARKDKALAETMALVVLKKKLQHLWGDEDDNTAETNEK